MLNIHTYRHIYVSTCIYSYAAGKAGKKLHVFLQHTYKNDVIIMEPHLNILKNSLTGY